MFSLQRRHRVKGAIDTVRKEHASGSILIVGHSYTNRMILSIIFGLTVDQMRSFLQQMEPEHRLSSLCARRSCTLLLGEKITLTSTKNLRFEIHGR